MACGIVVPDAKRPREADDMDIDAADLVHTVVTQTVHENNEYDKQAFKQTPN